MITLAIDPGECTGLAWGVGSALVACGAAKPHDKLHRPAAVLPAWAEAVEQCEPIACVLELPKFYGPRAYGHPKVATSIANSLIREAVTLGRWTEQAVELGMSTEEILPREWKGTVKKRTMCLRVIAAMTPEERRMVSKTLKASKLPKSKTHNVLDAIGIFFWKVGRL